MYPGYECQRGNLCYLGKVKCGVHKRVRGKRTINEVNALSALHPQRWVAYLAIIVNSFP